MKIYFAGRNNFSERIHGETEMTMLIGGVGGAIVIILVYEAWQRMVYEKNLAYD